MALVPKIDPNKIFASNAPTQDKPAAFDNYEKGMDETRKNLGRPTIKQSNYLHQTADQKILWIHQNGGGLPYDASIEYAENAVTLKDGELKQLVDGAWVETKTKSLPATATTTASDQNQQQINDFGGAKWYAKVGGYELGATVKLDNGDIVKSTEPNNTTDPNIYPVGWLNISRARRAFPSVLDNPLVRGDGVASDSIALQEYFRDADDNRKSSIFFPLRNHNYLIDAPLVVQEPLMIYGDAGATYNRGIGKDGKIIIGGTHAFDLGNYRTWSDTQNIDEKKSKNPADNWTLKNLAFIQKSGDPVRTKTALLHTAATNGPDRGLVMREVSATGLKHVLRTVDNGVQTQIATVVVENCVISNNELPLKFDGMCYGLRFVGNQCEQNSLGAIKGRVDGGITIEDNMLEGQRDVIDLEIPTTGNRPKISFKRNYLESNIGDFIFRAETNTSDAEIDIGGNFYWNHQAKHYVYLQGPSWLVKNTDPFPISLGPNTFIKYGSEIINSNIDYFKQDGFLLGFGSSVITSDFTKTMKRDDYTQSIALTATVNSYDTPMGNLRAIVGNFEYINIPLAVNAGDAYTITLLMTAERDLSESNIQVWDSNITAVVNEAGLSSGSDFKGRLGLITLTFKANATASSLRVRLFNSTTSSGKRKLFGACAKNHGSFVSGSLLNVYVAMPDVARTYPSQNLNYSVTASPTLNLTVNTDITTTVNDARFKVGDFIIVSIIQSPGLITRASASVRTDGVATVVLTPSTTSSGAVIGLKLKVVVN